MAAGLAALGIRPGERVALYMDNCPQYLFAYYAVPSIGAVAVPLSTFLTPGELARIVDDCGAAALIGTGQAIGRVSADLGESPSLRRLILCDGPEQDADPVIGARVKVSRLDDSVAGGARAEAGHAPIPEDTAVLVYTSGTTGAPKGVMLTHRNLLSNARACVEAVGITERDRVLLFLPMFHSFTLTVSILSPLLAGMSIVLCEKVDRAAIRRTIMKRRPTVMPAVPAIFSAMARAKIGRISRWLNPVRLYISGGAPLSTETLREFENRYRRPLCEGYGLSEASPVVAFNPASSRKPGSVGVPLPGVRVKVVDEDGKDVPSDQVGEIVVGGPSVMKGYYGRPEETREALRDGWLRTGDMASMDRDGYIFIMGRSKEMLIYRGMNVYPREIEEALEAHPGIKEAAVVGVADAKRGEVPWAVFARNPGSDVTERDLKRSCLARLARYKVPRVFLEIDSLPRNPAGKVLKSDLLDRLKATPATPQALRTPGSRPGRSQRRGT